MDLTGNLAGAVAALPKEVGDVLGPILKASFDRIDALEAKEASDMNALADKVIAALTPQLQAITQTVNEVGGESLALIRRIVDGGVHLSFGKESGAADSTVTVAG